MGYYWIAQTGDAGIAQLIERLLAMQKVAGLNPVSRSIFISPMSAPHRTAKHRDANLEKLYAQYKTAPTEPVKRAPGEAVKPTVETTPVLAPAEAAFVRRDLRRVSVAAFITLLLIVAVWLTSGQPYWTNFINWLAQLTHF